MYKLMLGVTSEGNKVIIDWLNRENDVDVGIVDTLAFIEDSYVFVDIDTSKPDWHHALWDQFKDAYWEVIEDDPMIDSDEFFELFEKGYIVLELYKED